MAKYRNYMLIHLIKGSAVTQSIHLLVSIILYSMPRRLIHRI